MATLTNDASAVVFPCPNCGKHEIRRSAHDRKLCAKYVCPGCNFEGPN